MKQDLSKEGPSDSSGSEHDVTTVDQLRAVIGDEVPGLAEKNTDALDEFSRNFIAASPFLILSTADANGAMDASPKGDEPGFVRVVDDKTLLIPDRAGNKLAYGHLNVLQNPRVGLIFIIPNTPETLRINGTARLSKDPQLLEEFSALGKPAKLMIRIAVDEVFFHCAKAFMRSRLWQAEQWPERHRVSFGEMFAARRAADEAGAKEMAQAVDQMVEQDYKDNL